MKRSRERERERMGRGEGGGGGQSGKFDHVVIWMHMGNYFWGFT